MEGLCRPPRCSRSNAMFHVVALLEWELFCTPWRNPQCSWSVYMLLRTFLTTSFSTGRSKPRVASSVSSDNHWLRLRVIAASVMKDSPPRSSAWNGEVLAHWLTTHATCTHGRAASQICGHERSPRGQTHRQQHHARPRPNSEALLVACERTGARSVAGPAHDFWVG